MALRGAFGDEQAGFCHFLAFLWQIHPFFEGNTRAVAVFSALFENPGLIRNVDPAAALDKRSLHA